MVIDDSLAFIPLLLTLAVNAALLVLFVVLKIKRIRISIFQFLAAIVMLLGCFFAVRTSSLFGGDRRADAGTFAYFILPRLFL